MGAGGNFDVNNPPILPGNYYNVIGKKKLKPAASVRGNVMVPLIGYDWGPSGEVLKISVDSPDAEIKKLGRSVYDSDPYMNRIYYALKRASNVYAYIGSGGTKATKTVDPLTLTAKYAGTLGNSIKVSIVANTSESFDVTVFLNGAEKEKYEGLSTIAQLITAAADSDLIVPSGTGNLTASAGISLEGGTNATVTNESLMAYFDKIEMIKSLNVALVITSDTSLNQAAKTKVNTLRNKRGHTIQFVMTDYAADNLGIINVTNSFAIDGYELPKVEAAAWVAGATAGASKTKDLTNTVVDDATAVVGEKNLEAAELAAKNGEFFFSSGDEDGQVVITYDINSLVNPSDTQGSDYYLNRTIRTLDSLHNDITAAIPPNTVDVDPANNPIVEGLGKAVMKRYSDEGAIKNFDEDNDFKVNDTYTEGDMWVFDCYVQVTKAGNKVCTNIYTQ